MWRFLTRQTQTVAMVANSEKQTVDTAFKLARTVLEQTPYTAAMIKAGTISVTADRIEYPALGNLIQGYSANPAALYGKKLTIAQVSELHAATSDAAYQVLASSTIDTDDGLVLVDSTVGPRTSPLFALYQLAQRGEDPTLFFSHIAYRDLADACENAPPWITPAALRSRAAQMLPAEFTQQHLNQWTSGVSALFPPEVLDRCRDSYRLDVPSITGGAAFIVGGGLDRAYGFSMHGDATVTTAVLKKHFRTDKSATMPYLAAVHGIMADKNPMQAMKFAKKMNEAGLTEAPEKKAEETTPYPVPIPPAPAPVPVPAPAPAPEQPKPMPEPDRKPETTEGTETTPPGLGGAVGTSAGQTAMPTASKEGGIAGGGKSGKVTSPASVILRDATGGARAKALRPITGTTSVGGSVARAIPFFGAFATFLDFLNYMNSQEPPPPSI